MKKGQVYVVFGSNAVMLSTNWNQAVYCRDLYFRSPCRIQKYSNRALAEEAAVDHLRDISPRSKVAPVHLEMGRVYAVSKLPNRGFNSEVL